ncbi:hypothetical protein [Pontibacillus yanchengensis]|nr:hypothetical protein [Pontibacillus yanchengensis]
MYHQQPYNMQMPYGQMMPGQQQGQMGYGQQMPMQQGQNMQQGKNMQQGQNMQQVKGMQDMKDYCSKHMYYFVIIQMNDGSEHEGIIEDIDAENVFILMPVGDEDEDGMESSDERQFGYGYGPGFGYGGGYGGGYGYGYPRRFRRFRRYRFPFFGIRSFFFPFFW